MGDRAVDCARLESVCAERHRGFESPPIRSRAFSDEVEWRSSTGQENGRFQNQGRVRFFGQFRCESFPESRPANADR